MRSFERNQMYRLVYIPTLLLLISFSSCQLFDKPEEVPSFVHIDEFVLQTTSSEGSDSEKITDVWVYVNDNLEGTWELPATIPLHYQGENNVKFQAGIKKNGIAANRDNYPFYETFELNMNLVPDSIIQVNPVIGYEDNLYIWLEDFEDPGIKWEAFSSSDTTMNIVTSSTHSNLIEGDAGQIYLSSSNFYCEVRTDELGFDNFPTHLSIPAYLEMNYSANYPFEIGLLSKDNTLSAFVKTPLITVSPTTDDNGNAQWNKTYLYLPDVTNFYPTATDFDLYISVLNSDATDGIELLFDNMKVIYRP